MVKSESTYRGAAEWSIEVTDHIIRNDQDDWHYCVREDDVRQKKIMLEDVKYKKMILKDIKHKKIILEDIRHKKMIITNISQKKMMADY